MASFTVRVELHDAEWTHYEVLHSAMKAKGFNQQIKGDNGVVYRLPWAEYDGSGNLTSAQVRDIACAAADSTGKKNAVLVTESLTRAWSGLALAS